MLYSTAKEFRIRVKVIERLVRKAEILAERILAIADSSVYVEELDDKADREFEEALECLKKARAKIDTILDEYTHRCCGWP